LKAQGQCIEVIHAKFLLKMFFFGSQGTEEFLVSRDSDRAHHR